MCALGGDAADADAAVVVVVARVPDTAEAAVEPSLAAAFRAVTAVAREGVLLLLLLLLPPTPGPTPARGASHRDEEEEEERPPATAAAWWWWPCCRRRSASSRALKEAYVTAATAIQGSHQRGRRRRCRCRRGDD